MATKPDPFVQLGRFHYAVAFCTVADGVGQALFGLYGMVAMTTPAFQRYALERYRKRQQEADK
jgi:hypothetical protein